MLKNLIKRKQDSMKAKDTKPKSNYEYRSKKQLDDEFIRDNLIRQGKEKELKELGL